MATELKRIIDKIKDLKSEVDTYRPLSKDQELKLTQKLRLDWNYHSCNIEGNTLTYGETKALLLHGVTAKGKPLKDHLEINGHNEAVELIFDVVQRKDRPLTETFIRELHKLIMPPDTYSEGQTLDGKPSRKKILVGQYKQLPNHVLTKTGELFHFASPEETPAKMEELMTWYRKVSEAKQDHPLFIACLFHYKFVRIHPFDDGNGRISRILMNFILMMHGYPPVIIPTEERTAYLTALELADQEDIDQFIGFVGEKLIKSLTLLKKVALGQSIEEEGDLDKMLAILDRQLEGLDADNEVRVERSVEVQQTLFHNSFNPLFNSLFSTLGKFDKYFKDNQIDLQTNLKTHEDGKNLKKKITSRSLFRLFITTIWETASLFYRFRLFKKAGFQDFNPEIFIVLKFNKYSYSIESGCDQSGHKTILTKHEKYYHEILSRDESLIIINEISSFMLSQITSELKKAQENGK